MGIPDDHGNRLLLLGHLRDDAVRRRLRRGLPVSGGLFAFKRFTHHSSQDGDLKAADTNEKGSAWSPTGFRKLRRLAGRREYDR